MVGVTEEDTRNSLRWRQMIQKEKHFLNLFIYFDTD